MQTLSVNKIKFPDHWQPAANCYILDDFLLVNNSIAENGGWGLGRDLAPAAYQVQTPEELERTPSAHNGSSV